MRPGTRRYAASRTVLRSLLRSSDALVRYGGDEFVLFVPLQSASDIPELAEKLLQNQRGRVKGRGKNYVYGTSIGICPYPCGAFSFDEALRAADLALYKAKSRGRGGFSVHE